MVAEDKIMTPYNIAQELHISLPLVYRQLRNGTIPHVKLGDKYLISRSSFEKWLSGEHPGADGAESLIIRKGTTK